MRAKFIKQAGWLGLLLFVLAGVVRAASNGDFDNVDIIDTSLDGKVAILRVGSDIGTTNKLLSIFVDLRNKTGHRIDIEIETIYKDGYGSALNAGSWISFTLKAHEDKEYRSTSISELASADSDFLVRIRRASASAAAN